MNDCCRSTFYKWAIVYCVLYRYSLYAWRVQYLGERWAAEHKQGPLPTNWPEANCTPRSYRDYSQATCQYTIQYIWIYKLGVGWGVGCVLCLTPRVSVLYIIQTLSLSLSLFLSLSLSPSLSLYTFAYIESYESSILYW
jgi:hypothetical protein